MIEKIREIKDQRVIHLKNELKRIKEELIKLGAQKIVLFGSAARDELGFLSDIDLIAILDSKKNFLERTEEIYKNLQPSNVDLFVYTPKEFEKMLEDNLFIQHINKEGKVIFEKP